MPYIYIQFHLLLHQQKSRRQVRIKPCFQKTFQNERSCQFLSSNNFQVQWAVKAQDVLNWAGNNIAEITKKYCESQWKKPLELQEGHRACYLLLIFLLLFFNLIELLVTGKSIVFCLNLSRFRIYKPDKDAKPVNYQQTGDDSALEIGSTLKNLLCYKKAAKFSITENNSARPVRAGSPCWHWELYLLLSLPHWLFTR